MTIAPTETQLSPLSKLPDQMMTSWLDVATKFASATTKTYFAGLEALVEQQQAAQQASLEWLTQISSTQSDVNSQLLDSSQSVGGDLTEVAEEATGRAAQAGAEVADRSRDVVSSASTIQRQGRTRTRHPQAATTTKQASQSSALPGPARWTKEAYESLTVVEVNEKLPQFSQRELREVEAYEQGHQARQTVLEKVSSLFGEQPVPDYDELNVPEVRKLLTDGDDTLAQSVRAYERPHKAREGVLQAAEAKLNDKS